MFRFSSRRAPALLSVASAAALSFPAAQAFAQSAAPAPTGAAAATEITVTATRTPLRASDAVADITVLDRAQIQRAEGRTLVELLAQQAGIQFSSNGGLGKTSSLFIRGLEARHTLLLVDGVRVGSATVGSPSLDNLPLEAIDRIEIVRGPLSSLYGSGAMGGVIQLFTKRGSTATSANAKLSAGSERYGQAAGGVAFGNGVFDAAVQAQHTQTRGISSTNDKVPFGSYNPDRDGFRQNAGSVRLGLQAGADWRVEALGLQSSGTVQIDDGPGVDARAGVENRLAALSLLGAVLPGWSTRLSVSDALDSYDTRSSASQFTTLGAIQTRQQQLSWENTVQTPLGSLLALAERIRQRVSKPGAAYAVSERDIRALALGLSGSAGQHAWQASLRRDEGDQFGGVNTGAVGYGYALTTALRLGASYGSSQTLPSFNQLYFPAFGNPNLLPETGRHKEISLRWTDDVNSLRAAYYQHRYRGFISAGPLPTNLPQVRIDGVTLAWEGRWRTVDLTASYDHVDPRNATPGSNYDKVSPRKAKQALRFGADWQAGSWSAGATLATFSHRWDDTANTNRLGGYGTLDLRADLALGSGLTLGLKLNNAAGKQYETALGYQQPGREGFVTLRYALQ